MLRGIWGFCFLSHKLLRWFVPFLLIAMFITNLLISSLPISPPFFKLTLYAQTAFYFTAGIAFFLGERKTKLLAVPLYYCLINLAAFVGILRYYTGDRQVAWEVAKTTR
jgi:hypothetical protein